MHELDKGLRKVVASAIFDPGATEGYKGDRTLTEWQTDAVMRVLSATSAGVTEEQVEAAAKYMARDHAMSGNRSREAIEEHVAKHWQRYSREARDILTAVWLDASPSKAEIAEMNATTAMDLKRAAEAVCWFDWSDNDADAVAAVDRLRAALEASRVAQVSQKEADDLDSRMKAAGMIPLSDLINGDTPLERWMAHTGVSDLATFEQWLEMRQREIGHMKAAYALGDKSEDDELFEWVNAHFSALNEVAANLRQMKRRMAEASALHTTPTPVSAPVGVVEDGEEDDNLIEGVAKAIALHGIGRGWDDFEEVNAYDFDRGDLREYARAAIYASPLTDLLPLRSPAVEGK